MNCPRCGVPLIGNLKICPKCKYDITMPNGVPVYQERQQKIDSVTITDTDKVKKKRMEAFKYFTFLIVFALLIALLSFAVIVNTRTTYSSQEEMKASLQGSYKRSLGYYSYTIEIEDETVIAHFSFSDDSYKYPIEAWNYRTGSIEASYLKIIVLKNGDIKLKNSVESGIYIRETPSEDSSTKTEYSVVSGEASKVAPTQKPINTPQPTPKASPSNKSYDAVLDYGLDTVAVFATEDALYQYVSALSSGNRSTIYDMISNGEMAYVTQGTKCNIIKSKLTCVQVKLVDGTYAGNTVWVIYEALQKK